MKQEKTWLERLSLLTAVVLLCAVLVNAFFCVRKTGELCGGIKNAELTQGLEATVYYEDRLFASIGYGISILPEESGKEERLADFMESSVQSIHERIIACGLLYGMMVSALAQYYLYCRYHGDTKKYVLHVILAGDAYSPVGTARLYAQGRRVGSSLDHPSQMPRKKLNLSKENPLPEFRQGILRLSKNCENQLPRQRSGGARGGKTLLAFQ